MKTKESEHEYEYSYPNHAQVREQASEILSRDGNRLMLIEAICLCFLVLPLYFSLYTLCGVCTTLFPMLPTSVCEWIWVAVLFFVTLFLTLPLIYGVFRMAGCMELGVEVSLSDLFAPFTSGERYGRALDVSWRLLRLVSVIGVLLWGTAFLAESLFVSRVAVWCFTVGFGIAEVIFGLLLFYGQFPYIAHCVRSEFSSSRSEQLDRIPMSVCQKCARRFYKGYILKILLGILSVGILLLMDVIPQMLIAYFGYCRHINDNDTLIGGLNRDE